MSHQVTFVCFLSFVIGLVIENLTDVNWIVGVVMAFIFGAVLSHYSEDKKIVKDK